MLKQYKKLKLSLRNTLELMYVIKGAKPLIRLKLNNTQYEDIKIFCRENSLYYQTANYKVLGNNDIEKAGFSNELTHLPFSSDCGYFLVFISKESLISKNDFSDIDDEKLGELLGYPHCCNEFFVRNIQEAKKYNMDYVPLILKNEQMQAPFYTNNLIRYFGYSLISHFPCSYHCEKSIEIARANLKILEENAPDIAERLKEKLKSFVIYTENNGIFYSNRYKKEKSNSGLNIVFKDIYASNSESKLYNDLKNHKKIDIINEKIVKVGSSVFYGDNMRVIEFI